MNTKRHRRARRVRERVVGTSARPRMSIFRSNRFTYVQLIDDAAGKTLAAASSETIKEEKTKLGTAKLLGKAIAEKAKKAGIASVIADRGSYRYHGRVKAVVEGVREGGIAV